MQIKDEKRIKHIQAQIYCRNAYVLSPKLVTPFNKDWKIYKPIDICQA